MAKPLIKICGITNMEDALFAAELNVWALGFVFAQSPRRISMEVAKDIIKHLPPYITRVGVFVNDNIANIEKIVNFCKLDIVQLHGDETPKDCLDIKAFAKVMKAFRIKDEDSLREISNYDVALYLLDTYSNEVYGGTGKTFNWDLVTEAKRYVEKIVLSGGLSLENIIEAIKKVEPYAVDISSGVEASPGKKDKDLIKNLVFKVRNL